MRLHENPQIYAQYGLDPKTDGAVLRSLDIFAERQQWPRRMVEDLLQWERAVRPSLAGMTAREAYDHVIAHLEGRGWTDQQIFAVQGWHEGVAKHGAEQAWPIGELHAGDEPHQRQERDSMTLTAAEKKYLDDLRRYRRDDPDGYDRREDLRAAELRLIEKQSGAARAAPRALSQREEKYLNDVREWRRADPDGFDQRTDIQTAEQHLLAAAHGTETPPAPAAASSGDAA
jgi:hypothetical protein